MDGALVAENVRTVYGDVVALDGVSLAVDEGEVFGLIGPNGAGKTTLIRALTGTTRVEGRIDVLGFSPRDVDPARIGLLPQEFAPADRLTPRELLRYYAGLYDEARDPDAVLDDVGLRADADTWYARLSGGQRRRTCVAIALVNDPDVLFLDEPTTGIDPAGQRAVWSLIDDLADGGATVFLTSHSMAEVERLADRVGLLAEGSLIAVGTPDALIDEYGGENRLVVRTPAGTDAVADAGYAVEASAEELVFHGVPPEEIGEVARLLDANGVVYDSLAWSAPDLEDVYLQLAGAEYAASRPPSDRSNSIHATGSTAIGTTGSEARAEGDG